MGVSTPFEQMCFALATGGIEVPRLLLASDRAGGGFGNQGDCLGQFYMCHFENACGRIVPHRKPVAFRFERTSGGIYCRRQIRFTPTAQRTHRLLNTVFVCIFRAMPMRVMAARSCPQ